MQNPTYIALSRMDAQQRAMDVTATNMANASTVGFKRENVLFSDFLSRQKGQADEPVQAYVQDRATYRDFAQGDLQETGNPFDLALGGQGYFQVATANGVRLTRSGRFEQANDGRIVDESGHALLDTTGQPLTLRAGARGITVSSDGVISSSLGREGKIGIVTVADQNGLQAEGSHLLAFKAPPTAVEQPNILQGMVESSNVQIMSETAKMLDLQRNFQFMAQFVNAEATRQQSAIDKIVQTNG